LIKQIGTDVHPELYKGKKGSSNKPPVHQNPTANVYFFLKGPHAKGLKIGTSFDCLTQAYNHIPGHDTLNQKNKVSQALVSYRQFYKDRPQCFSEKKFFPQTWILHNKA